MLSSFFFFFFSSSHQHHKSSPKHIAPFFFLLCLSPHHTPHIPPNPNLFPFTPFPQHTHAHITNPISPPHFLSGFAPHNTLLIPARISPLHMQQCSSSLLSVLQQPFFPSFLLFPPQLTFSFFTTLPPISPTTNTQTQHPLLTTNTRPHTQTDFFFPPRSICSPLHFPSITHHHIITLRGINMSLLKRSIKQNNILK